MVGREILQIDVEGPQPLGDVVYEALRDAIIKQVLKPEERLMETELAVEMGVSRTPVREAMRKLELAGYVLMLPRKGAYVARLSFADVHNLFEIRGALEILAAGLATSRITTTEIKEMEQNLRLEAELFVNGDLGQLVTVDDHFHNLIYSASRNNRLQNMLNDLRDQIQRFRATSLAVPGRMKLALAEHQKIVQAIAGGDIAETHQAIQAHLASAEKALLAVIGCPEKKKE